jgi:hypothetical protein
MNIDGEIINKIEKYIKVKNYLRILEKELESLLEEKLAEYEEQNTCTE